jgi:hypothetical protein
MRLYTPKRIKWEGSTLVSKEIKSSATKPALEKGAAGERLDTATSS